MEIFVRKGIVVREGDIVIVERRVTVWWSGWTFVESVTIKDGMYVCRCVSGKGNSPVTNGEVNGSTVME